MTILMTFAHLQQTQAEAAQRSRALFGEFANAPSQS